VLLSRTASIRATERDVGVHGGTFSTVGTTHAADIQTALMRVGITDRQFMGCTPSTLLVQRSTFSAAEADADGGDADAGNAADAGGDGGCCPQTPSRHVTAQHADQRNGNITLGIF